MNIPIPATVHTLNDFGDCRRSGGLLHRLLCQHFVEACQK